MAIETKSELETRTTAQIYDNTSGAITASGVQTLVLNIIDSLTGLWNNVSKTAAYTATDDDVWIRVDTTGGAVTITLPTAASIAGRYYIVQKIAGGNNVTVDGDGAETINGAANKTISTQWAALLVISDGTNWTGVTLTAA